MTVLKERPVHRQEYLDDYDNALRFISYFEQVSYIKKVKPLTFLEIGVGNKLVLNYAKELGIHAEGCDKNPELMPDILGDVRDLPIKDNKFDMISICEVLEHLPFEDFEKALKELHRVSKRHVLISLPYASAVLDIGFKFPLIRTLTNRQFFEIYVRLPVFWKEHKFDGKHYWEMGKRGYSKKRISKIISKYFNIIEESTPLLNKYHYFFMLEKKNLVIPKRK